MANTKKGVQLSTFFESTLISRKYFPLVIEQVYNKFLSNGARIL